LNSTSRVDGLYVTVYLNVELSKVGNSWYYVS